MRAQDDRLLYLGVGPLFSILLGVGLIPLREWTTASNLTFVFLVWTIVVGEFGGRSAAIATAFTSALSLNFFLTRPYLSLTIHGRDDVIAFVGLSACGLLAAGLGSRREARLAARRELEILHLAIGQLEQAGPVESRLSQVLASVLAAFPVSAVLARDVAGHTVSAAGEGDALRTPPPSVVLQGDGLGHSGRREAAAPLPAEGARVRLVAENHDVGWLDLWGNGRAASPETRRVLSTIARVVAALLAAGGRSLADGDEPTSRDATDDEWVVVPRGGPAE